MVALLSELASRAPLNASQADELRGLLTASLSEGDWGEGSSSGAVREDVEVICAGQPSAILDLASRFNLTARGLATCDVARLAACRPDQPYVLDDRWDVVLVWLGRALGYETLFLYASLIEERRCGIAELVDLRMPRAVRELMRSLNESELAWTRSVFAPKPEAVASAWIAHAAAQLSLRDPTRPDDEGSARQCDVRPGATLGCEGHISAGGARFGAALREMLGDALGADAIVPALLVRNHAGQ